MWIAVVLSLELLECLLLICIESHEGNSLDGNNVSDFSLSSESWTI